MSHINYNNMAVVDRKDKLKNQYMEISDGLYSISMGDTPL